MDRGPSKLHRCGLLLRNLAIAFAAYTTVYEVVQFGRTGSVSPFSKPPPKAAAADNGNLSGGVNWKLRPETLVKEINDAYMGERPHVDSYANYTRLIEVCRGSADRLERMRNVFNCLDYLAKKEEDYVYIPGDRPSLSSSKYPRIEDAEKPSETKIGECPGPVQLFHTYWTGPSTWRVEFFVKGYLYSQNLPCSRLYIWLDADTNPKAVEDMMKDPGFARFLPLVERGDITLKAWKFPSRIPLPISSIESDPLYARYLSKEGKLLPFDQIKKSSKKEHYIGDGVVLQSDGTAWLVLTERQMTFLPVAVSDAVRFVVLHLFGGVYLDMDVLLLRDMRPLLLPPDHNFAERWAVHSHPGDFNTAVLSLNANSSLSSYLVRGGVRMGLNFHPRIIGRMAWKDGRVEELAMFETGFFDPIWGEFNWGREGRCTVPCFKDYGVAFQGIKGVIKGEWQSYDGPQLELQPQSSAKTGELKLRSESPLQSVKHRLLLRRQTLENNEEPEPEPESPVAVVQSSAPPPPTKHDTTYGGREYVLEDDKYPPNNRTLENFFRGAWSYHIHNQWIKHPQPSSWFNIIQQAHDAFLSSGTRTNPYGESWTGPPIPPYDRWPEFD